MSKNSVLTDIQYMKYHFNKRLLLYIEEFRKEKNIPKEKFRVLDYGCGRGEYVLKLREAGYDAYGVEINSQYIDNSQEFFKKKGISSSFLSLITETGVTTYPDEYFDFIFSNYVLEHIHDLHLVGGELYRITKKNGAGFHITTAHHQPIEHHMNLPFVHWFPDSFLRKILIQLFVALNLQKDADGFKNKTILEKAEALNSFLKNETYYRSYKVIKRIFNSDKFDVSFITHQHPKIKERIIINSMFTNRLTGPLLQKILLNYTILDISLEKHG